MRWHVRLGAVAVACALPTSLTAETINTAMNLPTGAVINLVIEKTRERSGGQPIPKMTVSFRYKQAIASTEEGYVITQTLTGFDAPPEAQAGLQEAAGVLKTITFETDASLAPVKVHDREAVLRSMFDSVTSMTTAAAPTADPQAADTASRAIMAMRAMFEGLSDEQLAQTLLKEQAALSQFQSVEIDLTEPVAEVIETPNPTGGPPFKQTVTIKLESLDKKAGRAVISSVDETDPEALKASSMAMLQRLVPEQRDKIAAELASAKMEMRNACRYDLDLKTGLTTHADCTRTVRALGGDGGLSRRVDRTVISQTLKLP